MALGGMIIQALIICKAYFFVKTAVFWAFEWTAMRFNMVIAFLEFLEPNIILWAANHTAFERNGSITLPEKGNLPRFPRSQDPFQGLSCSQKLRAYQKGLGAWASI